jgi:hypothetical protein
MVLTNPDDFPIAQEMLDSATFSEAQPAPSQRRPRRAANKAAMVS